MKTIKFYHINKPFGEFSNFSRHPIVLKGKMWPTTEHYFQAQKFVDTEHEEVVRNANTPMIAAQMGRDRTRPLRKDWEVVKGKIMREAVLAKFTQHESLRELLLSTRDAFLIEHTSNDRYWADGGDGSGLNKLGEILMSVREQLSQ